MTITVRAATLQDVEGIARVHVDTWRTTYRGLIPDAYLDNLTYEPRQRMWNQILGTPGSQNLTFVAVDEAGQIVGFINGGPERENDPFYQSELYAIYILASQHGHGTGRVLVRTLAQSLIQSGFTNMLVWVLAGNPATQFYQRLGAQYVTAKPVQIGGADLQEFAYGWPDLQVLL
ncbi:GNAT family N-acetyltransferase [Dictyobacter kobayashii]|uniref:Putative N-acetyltransferase YuaI n=1 Tax=Dictyobacter kobayashii TaxID=2014872 RepID=A0A402AMM4_9CHLR|nr:GNAT family N-acetyltransferase [Dictyobacter kobayashii]GCE20250.1 putative N-acetyltransferase YuaI [Dictyobacter kobayashii]